MGTYNAPPIADAAILMKSGVDELSPKRTSMIDFELAELADRLIEHPDQLATMLHVVALTAGSAFIRLAAKCAELDPHYEIERVCHVVDDLVDEFAQARGVPNDEPRSKRWQ